MIWRGVGRESLEEKSRLIRRMMELTVGKRINVRRMEERKGLEWETMVLVELKDER